MMTIEKMPGGIRKFTMVGGYPIFYVKLSEALCPECAAEDADGIDCAAVNWEDESLYCDECGDGIECAYPSDATDCTST
jgi:hypothetical protein